MIFLNDATLIKHYGDSGFMIIQNETQLKYTDAVDIVPCIYTYTETDEPIPIDDEEVQVDG